MKAAELLIEGYSSRLETDLQDLLAVAKGRGMAEVPTNSLVKQLLQLGHNINSNSIMTILSGNPFVQSATPDQVNLTQDDTAGVSGGAGAPEDNQERVSQLAQQTADSDIKNDGLV